MTLQQRFWLLAMDATLAVFGFGSRPFTWALVHASDATDWGSGRDAHDDLECDDEEREEHRATRERLAELEEINREHVDSIVSLTCDVANETSRRMRAEAKLAELTHGKIGEVEL